MSMHGRAAEYLDGSLGRAGEAAFLEHTADCAICQAALTDELQLRDHEEIMRAARRAGTAGGCVRVGDTEGAAAAPRRPKAPRPAPSSP